MSRPKGRRTVYRKIAFYPSELARALQYCPEGPSEIARVSYLCRAIALGEYRIQAVRGADPWDPPELVEARAQRAPGQAGRTKGTRTQRDLLFYPKEWKAFEGRLPEGVKIQAFLRGLVAGLYTLVEDQEGRELQRDRAKREVCALCGGQRQDLGEYCFSCRAPIEPVS